MTKVTFVTSATSSNGGTVEFHPKLLHDVTSTEGKMSIFKQLDKIRENQEEERNKAKSNTSLHYAKLDFSHMPPLSKSVKPNNEKTFYSRIDHLKTRALQYLRREK